MNVYFAHTHVFRQMSRKFQRCRSRTFPNWEHYCEVNVSQMRAVNDLSTVVMFWSLELQELADIGQFPTFAA